MTNSVELLSVAELANTQDRYIIPIYQRNYAWTKDEVEELICDIRNANPNKQKNYYIGSLVVFKRASGEYEVIDGQQRLTTLKLILSALDEENNINLSFEHRESSNYSLNNLGNGKSNSIEQRFSDVQKLLSEDDKSNFKKWLNFIKILRTEVPEHTDLNHYFEIMNNRGEQLEKHEIVKAHLMGILTNEQERKAFANIWDACSDMSKFAIKGFSYISKPDQDKGEFSLRTRVFGNEIEKIPTKFEDISKWYKSDSNQFDETKTILTLLSEENNQSSKYDIEYLNVKFKSVIDYPNFLMHVLKIYTKEDISLDDKKLYREFIRVFDNCSEQKSVTEKVKEFSICLLRIRLIFDRYIIKSKDELDWRLFTLKKYSDANRYLRFNEIESDIFLDEEEGINKNIINLLSMFHVSFRQRIYKEWLFDILSWLNKENNDEEYSISSEEYLKKLECLANDYLNKRLVLDGNNSWVDTSLCNGTRFEHYVFNYLDYLLLRDFDFYEIEEFISKENFRFTMSSNSVEHYFPQSKEDDLTELKDVDKNQIMNNLGNLCLIPNYQNSSLSNDNMEIKKANYSSGKWSCNSVKQAIMLAYESWNSQQIKEHCEEMLKILKDESLRITNSQS